MDWKFNDNSELMIANGDFVIERDSRLQEARAICKTYQGNWKQSPLTGVGEAEFVNGRVDAALRRKVALQMKADGKRLRSLKLDGEGKIRIEVE